MKNGWRELVRAGMSKKGPHFDIQLLPLEDIQRYEQMGILQRGPDATELNCDCVGQPLGIVSWFETETGSVPYLFCPECTGRELKLEELWTWDVQFPALLRKIAAAAGWSEPVAEMPDLIWYLGRKKTKHLYFLRDFHPMDIKAIRALFKNRPEAIVIVGLKWQAELAGRDLDRDILALEPYLSEENGQFSFDQAGFAQVLEGMGPEAIQKRAKRGERTAMIEKLIAILKDCCASAMDAVELGREIPPRPTQAWLAQAVNTRQDTVSRCLNDPSTMAEPLRCMWNNMETPEGLRLLRPYIKR